MTVLHSPLWRRVGAIAAGEVGERGADGQSLPIGLAAARRIGVILGSRPPERPWRRTARPVQIALAESTTPYTMFLAGRGAGKTWGAANAFAEWTTTEIGEYGIIAPTFGDCRSICVEGPSGLLNALGADLESYNRSTFEIRVRGGSVIHMASDDAPARIRGRNYTGIWADEVGSWRRLRETWEEGVEFATRIGSARRLITTTPKRGNKIIKELHDRAERGDPEVTVLRGHTMDNAANLSDTFLNMITKRYEGTTLGRQELGGELLSDVEGALVNSTLIEQTRCHPDFVPDLWRVYIGVDPAVTASDESDHTGIIVVGIGPSPLPGYPGEPARVRGDHLYFLADYSVRSHPEAWARRVLEAADEWDAEGITAEKNQGGDLVETMLRMVARAEGRRIPRIIPVWASRGKYVRAEPVASVFEQGRAHIVGALPRLEDGWTGWRPGDPDSPDQLDAAVHASVGLMPELGAAGRTPTEVRIIA